jgi:hypothetical protein
MPHRPCPQDVQVLTAWRRHSSSRSCLKAVMSCLVPPGEGSHHQGQEHFKAIPHHPCRGSLGILPGRIHRAVTLSASFRRLRRKTQLVPHVHRQQLLLHHCHVAHPITKLRAAHHPHEQRSSVLTQILPMAQHPVGKRVAPPVELLPLRRVTRMSWSLCITKTSCIKFQ